jgi:hypothetical protein
VLCCAVLCCAVLCCAVLCFYNSLSPGHVSFFLNVRVKSQTKSSNGNHVNVKNNVNVNL